MSLMNMRPRVLAVAVASLFAPLTSSLALTKGVGAPTFTRATAATVTDFEGVLRTAKPGEARFEGARRVENLNGTSRHMDAAAGWTTFAMTVAPVRNSALFSDGTLTATTVVFDADSGSEVHKNISAPAGVNIFSLSIKGVAGNKVRLNRFNGTDGALMSSDITLNGAWQVISFTFTSTAANSFYYLFNGSNGLSHTVAVRDIQLEDVSLQSVKTVGEYVSNGILSSPYHGAGIDGVKYLTTKLDGSAIAESTLKGVVIEGASTNMVRNSTGVGATVGTPGVWPTNWTIFANSTLSSAIVGTGIQSGINYVDIRFYGTSNGTYYVFVFDGSPISIVTDEKWTLSAYCAVVGGSLANTTGVNITLRGMPALNYGQIKTSLTSSLQRFSVSATATATGTTMYPSIGLDFNSGVAIDVTLRFGLPQLEKFGAATSPILTTGSIVTRNADALTYPNSGNVSDTAGTVYMEATPGFNIPNSSTAGCGNNCLIDFDSSNGSIEVSTNQLLRRDGTNNLLSPAFTPVKNTTYKIGSRWGGAGQRNWLNGTAGANGAFDGSINSGSNMRLGANGAGSAIFGGPLKNLCIYKKALSDSTIARITT